MTEPSNTDDARRSTRRMTGRGLLLALAVTVATVVGANAVFAGSEIARGLRDEARYTALPAAFEALPWDPDVVFMGDSRVILDPADLEAELARGLGRPLRVYSLNVPGGPPIAHLGWTGYLLDRARPPELVVILLSEFMFGTGLDVTLSRESVPSVWQAADAPTALLAGMPVEDVLTAVMCDSFTALRLRRGALRLLFDGGDPRPAAELGVQGFHPSARVDARTQHARALGRAAAYKKELSPPAEVNEEQLAYFAATLDRLQGAGVKVLVSTSPASTPLRPNHDLPLYRASFARARAIAAERGVPFYAYEDTATVADPYFSDGDHLTAEGARRYSVQLARDVLVPFLAGRPAPTGRPERWFPAAPAPGCRVLFDFEETQVAPGWTFTGDAFREPLVTGAQGPQQDVTGYGGLQLLNTHTAWRADAATGTATSPPFALDRDQLRLKVAGGDGEGVRVELVVTAAEGAEAGEEVVRVARGHRDEHLAPVTWDVAPWRGRTAHVRVIDSERGPWGHVLLDDVEACD
ncbi:MAG: hypothetical protein CVU56_26815 [Deltaproteobacteria bacterium HGW-Deltaproteobacteria-14]|jgi:hypothetical protein|nr:MAG: hypothetical protein CVU56_26815 [Deltaproteobacteria bacterium HGW-Deltaproteobacteria-14]